MPLPTPLEKAYADLQKCREETYSRKSIVDTLKITRLPSQPFVGYSPTSHSAFAREEEKRTLLLREKHQKMAKKGYTKEKKRAVSSFFADSSATQKTGRSSFSSARSSP